MCRARPEPNRKKTHQQQEHAEQRSHEDEQSCAKRNTDRHKNQQME